LLKQETAVATAKSTGRCTVSS